MSLSSILQEKREWNEMKRRVAELPEDYRIIYEEMQKYLFKISPENVSTKDGVLFELADLFEEGAKNHQKAIEVTGPDVAAFADALIGDTPTLMDKVDRDVDKTVADSIKKPKNKNS